MLDKYIALRNIASLGAMQIINYVLPILIMPFLVLKIGISGIGLIATFSAICAYIQLVIDYGFNLSATREIAKDGFDCHHASLVSSSVFTIKIVISSIVAISSFLIFHYSPDLSQYTIIFMLTLGVAIFQSMFPVWHFQGAERMQYITLCNSIPKIISAAMVFLVVRNPGDIWKVQGCFFIGSFASFIASVIVLKYRFDFKLSISLEECKNQLRCGYSIFTARLASGLYKYFNVLILGFFAGAAAVGAYSIAERILRSAQMVQNVVGDTLYPSFAKESVGDSNFFKAASKKYKFHIITIYSMASLLLFLFSDLIGHLIGRTSAEEVSSCLKIMSIAFLFGGLNYVCAILGLTSCGYYKQFSVCVIATGIFNVFIATTLSYLFSFYGASLALTVSELFLLCLVIYFSKRTGVL